MKSYGPIIQIKEIKNNGVIQIFRQPAITPDLNCHHHRWKYI